MGKLIKETYTTEKIAFAFLDLLTEKPFDYISVTQLVNRAGVGRASFYRSFSTTRDVLNYAIDKIIEELATIFQPVLQEENEQNWKDFLSSYICLLSRSRDDILKMRSDNMFLFMDIFSSKIREMAMPAASQKDKYRLAAKIAIINTVLLVWKENGFSESQNEIIDQIMPMIMAF